MTSDNCAGLDADIVCEVVGEVVGKVVGKVVGEVVHVVSLCHWIKSICGVVRVT